MGAILPLYYRPAQVSLCVLATISTTTDIGEGAANFFSRKDGLLPPICIRYLLGCNASEKNYQEATRSTQFL
jgi:hypothetical protein